MSSAIDSHISAGEIIIQRPFLIPIDTNDIDADRVNAHFAGIICTIHSTASEANSVSRIINPQSIQSRLRKIKKFKIEEKTKQTIS